MNEHATGGRTCCPTAPPSQPPTVITLCLRRVAGGTWTATIDQPEHLHVLSLECRTSTPELAVAGLFNSLNAVRRDLDRIFA